MATIKEEPSDPTSSVDAGPSGTVGIKEEPCPDQLEASTQKLMADGGSSEAKEESAKFKVEVELEEEEEEEYAEFKEVPPKTKPASPEYKSLPGLLIYNEFCLEMGLSTDLKKVPIKQLAANLEKFFCFVRVKPAMVLQQLFDQICLVVETVRRVRVKKDLKFRRVVRVCTGRLESMESAPAACSDPQITEQLSMFCLRKLLISEELRPTQPTGLSNLALLYVMVYLCKGITHWNEMKEFLKSMKKSSFVCRMDVSLCNYISIRRKPGCAAGRIYEVPGNPICPFKILRLYLSKLSKYSSYLWQRPKENPLPTESWYYPDTSNTIKNEWLLELTEKASMTVSYTNMSLVLTPKSVLDATLADPVFAQTIADEIKNIPEPPEYDPSKLETALPAFQDHHEIKLLNSCEAQVEIRMTEIFWKELFPEWDTTRLEAGYQNHVDFMHHLLDMHKSCRAERCRSFETETEESRVSAPKERTSVNMPINVAQHGIHNSSVLTVVNNNNVPQNMAGTQNVIVPLNDLLKSLGANAGLNGQSPLGAGSTTTSPPGGLGNTLNALPALPQSGAVGTPLAALDPNQLLAQNASILGQLGGTSVVLPSMPPSNLSANSASTPSTPVIQSGTINSLLGGSIPSSQGTNLVTQSFQTVLPNLQPGQNLLSADGLAQTASILAAASSQPGLPGLSTPVVLQPGGSSDVPSSSKAPGTSTSQVLQQAMSTIPSNLLDNLTKSMLAGSTNLAQVANLPTSQANLQRVLASSGGSNVSTQDVGVHQGAQPASENQVIPNPLQVPQASGHDVTSPAQLSALAGGNPNTFLITSQGIIAIPNLQQQPAQTVVSGLNAPGTVVNAASVSKSTSGSVTGTDITGVTAGLSNNSVGLSTNIVSSMNSQLALSGITSDVSTGHVDKPVTAGTLDLSTRLSCPESQVGQPAGDKPLDLSKTNATRIKQNVVVTKAPSAATCDGLLSNSENKTKPSICDSNGGLVTAIPIPFVPSLPQVPTPLRSPPPPYPGVPRKLTLAQSSAQLGYPRFVNDPYPDVTGYMTSLKRKGTTGKSVRELLDKKRRNTPVRSRERAVPVVRKRNMLMLEERRKASVEPISQAIDANAPTKVEVSPTPVQNAAVSLVSSAVPNEQALQKQSPVKSSDRKSRRKPRQVFKRVVAYHEDGS